MGADPASLGPAYSALADAIMETFSRNDAGQGLDPRPAPRLAISGDHPPMTFEREQERHNENGADTTFVRRLQQIVGKVRFGWAVGATILSPIFLLAALLVHNGWIETPAKDTDMKVVQAKLTSIENVQSAQAEALRSLNIATVRLEEGNKLAIRTLDSIDGKLARIEEQHLTIMRAFATSTIEEQKANTAPATPPPPIHRPRAKALKKENGFSLFR